MTLAEIRAELERLTGEVDRLIPSEDAPEDDPDGAVFHALHADSDEMCAYWCARAMANRTSADEKEFRRLAAWFHREICSLLSRVKR